MSDSLFQFSHVQHKAAFRTVLAVLLATFIALSLHFDQPYWAGISVVVIMSPYIGSIKKKGTLRIIGTILGALLGYFIAGFILVNYYLFLIVLFAIVAINFYFAANSKHPYVFLLLAMSCFLILGTAITNPSYAFNIVIWRCTEIITGVTAAYIISACILPISASELLQTHLNNFLSYCADYFSLDNHPGDCQNYLTKIQNELITVQKLYPEAEQDSNSIFFENRTLKQLVSYIEVLYGILENYSTSTAKTSSLFQEPTLSHAIKQLQQLYQVSLKKIIDPKNHLSELNLPLSAALDNLHSVFKDVKRKMLLQKLPVTDSMQFDALILLYETLTENIQNITAFFISQKQSISEFSTSWKKLRPFKFNIEILKYSIKNALGIIAATAIWLTTSWEGGLQGLISSLIISMQKNIYDVNHIALMRIVGCLLGAIIALLGLHLFFFNFYLLSIYLIIFVWVFSYITFSKSMYAYIGIQANIALLIALVNLIGPPISPGLIIGRLSGMLLGIITSSLVNIFIWPVHPKQIFQRAIKNNYMYLQKLLPKFISSQSLSPEDVTLFQSLSQSINQANLALQTIKKYRENKERALSAWEKHLEFQQYYLDQFKLMDNLNEFNQVKATTRLFSIDFQKIQNDLLHSILCHAEEFNKNTFTNITTESSDELHHCFESIHHNSLQLKIKHLLLVNMYNFLNTIRLLATFSNNKLR